MSVPSQLPPDVPHPASSSTGPSSASSEFRIRGAAPLGATDENSASVAVREMFNEIAPRYDLANHLLSLNIDKLWWRRVARTFSSALADGDARILDLCCGTGDMALALSRRRSVALNRLSTNGRRNPPRAIVGLDFAHCMLERGSLKFAGHGVIPVEADALCTPFADAQFRLVISAFGFRNLANYDAGVREIYRLLAPGGEFGILDFAEPDGWWGGLYQFYFQRILPQLGSLITGVKGPYKYLPASVSRFPRPEEMLQRMRLAGFSEVSWTPYTLSIAGLYKGRKL